MMKRFGLILLAIATLSGGMVMADALTVNFNSYSLGNLPGSSASDTRTPGGPNWWYPGNAPTSAQVVSVGGNHVLQVYNNGNGNTGVIDNIHSPQLNSLAGETGAGTQPGATANTFSSSFTFNTISSTAVSGFAFKTESYGRDRTTYLSFYNDGSGNLVADYIGTTDPTFGTAASFNDHLENTPLTWGAEYTVDTTINFVNGPNNDIVTVNLFDSSNNLVWSLTDKTWEQYYRNDPEQAPNGNIDTGADSVQFQMRGSTAGASNGVYIDSLSYSSYNTAAVPLPSAAWGGLALLGGLGLLGVVKRHRRQVA